MFFVLAFVGAVSRSERGLSHGQRELADRDSGRAIADFFAIAQISGALGPAFSGALIGDGSSRSGLVLGYVVRGLIMVVGGVIELIGIKAEGQSLETVTTPLTAVSTETVEEGVSDG